jgi:hypothetical protein
MERRRWKAECGKEKIEGGIWKGADVMRNMERGRCDEEYGRGEI